MGSATPTCFWVETGSDYYMMMMELLLRTDLIFDIAPPPHRRITTPGLTATFGHIYTEAGTPTLGIWSAVWGRQHLPVSGSKRGPIII